MKLNQLFFRGIFVFLMLGCFSAFAQNDLCADAIEIQCGGISVNGTTTGATFDDVGFCDTSNTAPGVWYKFVGEGSDIVLSTCGTAAYDTKISIFSGDCGALVCETGNDDFSGCAGFTSQTDSLLTVAGTTYYVLVHGFGGETGDFTLTLTCTDPPPALENDLCPDAISLNCGDSVTGSTEDATDTGAPGLCNDVSVTAPGVWYTIEGTGGPIALDTCGSDFDTKLSVYEGVCGNFDCVLANDDDASFGTFDDNGLGICNPGFTVFQSSLEFESTAGTLYYIYVHGFGSSTGNFNLNVDCACFVTVDDCNTVYLGAEPYASSSADLSAVGGGVGPFSYEWSDGQTGSSVTVSPTETTVYTVTMTDLDDGCVATAETTVVVVDADCDNNPNNDKVEICHRGETICVSINAVNAHLNHGDSIGACDQLNCDTRPGCSSVTDPADFAIVTDPEQDVSWSVAPGYVAGYTLTVGTSSGGTDVVNNADVGNVNTYDLGPLSHDTTYYVTVTAYNDNGSALSCPESSFTTDFAPANDLCADAISLACGDSVTGSTAFANDTESPGTCDVDVSSPGVWYTFLGTGQLTQVDTCDSPYDTKLSVYEGECGNLSCVIGNDDDHTGITTNGLGICTDNPGASIFVSSLEFESVEGTLYTIYVHGFGTSTGDFNLNVNCIEPPVIEQGSDDCGDAVAITCGDTVNGTTTGYTDSGVDCSFNFGAAGVWYKFDGTGDTVTVNTCGAGTNYDTKIDVFSGDCGALICEGSNDDFCGLQSEVTFATSAGTSYYIYVNGFSGDGNYELSVTCIPAPIANPNRGIESLSWGLTPNPSKGDVELDLSHFVNSNVTVDVIGFTGKLLATYKLEDLQNPKFNLQLNSSLTNGMYLVRVSSDEQVSSKRLILNR